VSARKQISRHCRQALAILNQSNNAEALDKTEIKNRHVGTRAISGHQAAPRHRQVSKTEQLRNVGLTAPYMHDGSLHTLWDVMDHYNKGGETNAYLDGGIEPLNLSENEINEVSPFYSL